MAKKFPHLFQLYLIEISTPLWANLGKTYETILRSIVFSFLRISFKNGRNLKAEYRPLEKKNGGWAGGWRGGVRGVTVTQIRIPTRMEEIL